MNIPYRGKNQYRTFLKAGNTIAGKISKLDGVVGVLGTGSIGRKFGDKYSDLDLTVFAHQEHVKYLSQKGCLLMLSNADTPLIRKLSTPDS